MSLLDLLTLEHTHTCPSCRTDYGCSCPACSAETSHYHTECPKCAVWTNQWAYPFCLGFKFVSWHTSS